GRLGVAPLPRVHQFVALVVHQACDVGHPDVLAPGAHGDQQIEAGEGRRTGAGGDDLDRADVFADKAQAVLHGGADDDGGAVLVVVEDGDVHARPECRLDLEAFGRLDVFQVDGAEGGLERGHDVDQL